MKMNEKIKKIRVERSKTQKEIGLYLGMSQAVYSRYESGSRKISVELLEVLAKYYDISPSYFYESHSNIDLELKKNRILQFLLKKSIMEDTLKKYYSDLNSNDELLSHVAFIYKDHAHEIYKGLVEDYKNIMELIKMEDYQYYIDKAKK